MKNNEKKVVGSENKTREKTVSGVRYSSNSKTPIWLFDNLDRTGKFAFDLERKDFNYKEFLSKMISYSNMTWGEILRQTHDDGKSKHHILSPDTISKDAIKSIEKKQLIDNVGCVFSFAFQNKLRIIGLKDDEFFHVIWYDPNHEFSVVKK